MHQILILVASFLFMYSPDSQTGISNDCLLGNHIDSGGATAEDSAKVAGQNPSPMVDQTRSHRRVGNENYKGIAFGVPNLLAKEIGIFVPERYLHEKSFDLLIHFHGSGQVVEYAATRYPHSIITASITLGTGSSVYANAFRDSTILPMIIDSISSEIAFHLHHKIKFQHIVLSGWSAGYGAVRQILSTSGNYDRVSAVLLLDGIHAGYIPDGVPLSEGGKIDSTELKTFLLLAEDASHRSSKKKFLITHSEIFPGTFVSTTEATDYVLGKLGMKRFAVLRWGPLGMQQVSVARRGHFAIYGFAGNTAPDHIDHFEALYYFLKELMQL